MPGIRYGRGIAALALALFALSCHREPPRPRNVILILVDTLRADRLSAWGYARPTSPNLDAFARESVRFENARSQSACTFPSANSLLTSRWPAAFLGQPLASTQPEISPLRIDCFENGELDQAMRLRLAPLAWSPLGGGRLLSPRTARDHAVAAELDRIAGEQRVSRSVAAYGWLMAHPAGIIPIIGSQSAERIAAGAAATAMLKPSRTAVTTPVAATRQGRSFSVAIRAATRSIQASVIRPSANSAAISAQQQPRQYTPCPRPSRKPPPTPRS